MAWSSTPPKKREWAMASALILLALLLRIGFVLQQPPGFYFEDSRDYDRAAKNFLSTGHFDHEYIRFPVYPLLMAGCYKLFGTGPLPLRMMQAVLGALTCAVVWRMARGMFGARTGSLALLVMAVFPPHIVLSGIEYPTAFGILVIWIALWMLLERQHGGLPRLPCLLALGSSVGLACCTFPAGLALAFFVVLCLAFERRGLGEKLADLITVGALAMVLLTPWIGRMAITGDFRPLVLKAGLHLPVPPPVPVPQWEGNGTNLLEAKVGGLVRYYGWTARHFGEEFLHFWNPYPDRLHSAEPAFRLALHNKDPRMEVSNPLVGEASLTLYAWGYGLLLCLAALGTIAAWTPIEGIGILLGWPIILAACYSLIFTKTRYRMPADPAFIILASYAALALFQKETWGRAAGALRRLLPGKPLAAEAKLSESAPPE